MPSRTGPPSAAGRWSLVPVMSVSSTERALARSEVLLDRYGIVTRGAVMAEGVPDGFAGVYRVLAAAEEAGRVRRGYFVEGLGAAQFGSAGAVDRLRAQSQETPMSPDAIWETPRETLPTATVLAAADPANPYGAALPWPDRSGVRRETPGVPGEAPPSNGGTGSGHRPGRKSGAMVVLVDGELVLYVERGGRTLLTWHDDATLLAASAQALARTVREGSLGGLTITTVDGDNILGSTHPIVEALTAAGFHTSPRGLRLRR